MRCRSFATLAKHAPLARPVGVNIGAIKGAEDRIADYETGARFADCADYLTGDFCPQYAGLA